MSKIVRFKLVLDDVKYEGNIRRSDAQPYSVKQTFSSVSLE